MKEIKIEFYKRQIELIQERLRQSTNFTETEKEWLYNEIENYKQDLQRLNSN